MKSQSKRLEFHTYSEIRLPFGFCLFFPRLPEAESDERVRGEEELLKRRERRKQSDVKRIMIVAADPGDRRILSGVAVRSLLHVELGRERFFELLRELAERDLQRDPLPVEFEVKDGQLVSLRIDRELIKAHLGQSDIAALQSAS